MGEFDSNKYKQEFAKKAYDRIPFDIPKGQKAVLAQYAKEHGYKSLNNFLWQCVSDAMKNNKSNSKYISVKAGDIKQNGKDNKKGKI